MRVFCGQAARPRSRASANPFLCTYYTRASVVAQLAMPTGQTIAYARDAHCRAAY